MAKILTILLIAIVLEAIGVVYLSRGLKQIGEPDKVNLSGIMKLVGRGLTNTNIIRGVFFEALFFVGLLMLMARAEVSFIWPLTALGFVATTLSAKLFLHEEVSLARWTGVLLITAGAALVSWTEKAKEPPPPTSPAINTFAPPHQ
jgi:drug/metabolite transporter (DMT)-like permease